MQKSQKKHKKCRFCQLTRNLLLIMVSALGIFSALIFLPQWFNATQEESAYFKVLNAESEFRDGSYFVNARLKMDFSPEVVEALENGVPLNLLIELKVWQQQSVLDKVVKESTQRFEYRYNALTGIHSMIHKTTGQKYNFDSREDALALLGNIYNAHLIEQKDLDSGSHHRVEIRVLLDIWTLPTALRPVASLSPQWRLESEWYSWMLN